MTQSFIFQTRLVTQIVNVLFEEGKVEFVYEMIVKVDEPRGIQNGGHRNVRSQRLSEPSRLIENSETTRAASSKHNLARYTKERSVPKVHISEVNSVSLADLANGSGNAKPLVFIISMFKEKLTEVTTMRDKTEGDTTLDIW